MKHASIERATHWIAKFYGLHLTSNRIIRMSLAMRLERPTALLIGVQGNGLLRYAVRVHRQWVGVLAIPAKFHLVAVLPRSELDRHRAEIDARTREIILSHPEPSTVESRAG